MGGNTAETPPPPKEYDDTISASGTFFFIDLIAEGPVKGLVQDKRSIFFDRTQLEYEDGTTDFEVATRNFKLEDNFKFGYHNQSAPTSEFSNTCSFLDLYESNNLTTLKPLSYAISTSTYQLLSKVVVNVKIQSLQLVTDKDIDYGQTGWTEQIIKDQNGKYNKGDQVAAPLEFNIFVRKDNGPEILVENVRIIEKCATGFILSKTILFPKQNAVNPELNWDDNDDSTFFIRLQRVSEDQKKTQKLANNTSIDSILVFQDISLTYPCSCLAALKLNTDSFQNLPERLYLMDLKLVKVPINHTTPRFDNDGVMTRAPSYSGNWNGSFKLDWTNNPAWIIYDILTNKRYGLGEEIPSSNIDKWSIYDMARYCDAVNSSGVFEGVPGVYGIAEQRFTANIFLAEANDAPSLLKDMSSILRGNIFWNNNHVAVVQDKPRAVRQIFTNSTVIGGEFSYSSAASRQKPSAVKVRWNDPSDFYSVKTEHVEDLGMIARQGFKEIDVAAFGCTSLSQARRFGRWMLATESLESRLVNFKAPIMALDCTPGDIVEIRDDILDRASNGGRILSSTSNTITLDKVIDYSVGGAISVTNYIDSLSPVLSQANSVTSSEQSPLIRPSYVSKFNILGQTDNAFAGSSILTVDGDASNLVPFSPFSVNAAILVKNNKYRVMDISEFDENGNVSISCAEYSESKFDDSEISANEGANSVESNGINYADFPIYPPSSLEVVNRLIPPSNNYGTFSAGSGAFLIGYAISGRLLPSGSYYSLNRGAGNSFTDYIAQTGVYEYVVKSRRTDGVLSSGITTIVTGDISLIPVNTAIDSPYASLQNGLNGSASTYATPNPRFSIASPNSTSSDSYRLTQDIYLRVRNESVSGFVDGFGSGSLALDWISLGGAVYGRQAEIDNEGKINGYDVSGWKFRKIGVDCFAVTEGGESGIITSVGFDNPAPPPCSISFNNITSNSFDYSISPQQSFTDLKSVEFFISTGSIVPTGSSATKYSFVDTLSHNLNATGLNVWFKTADTFGDVDLILNGPFPVVANSLSSTYSGSITGAVISSSTSRKSGNFIRFTWPEYTDFSLTNYILEVQNSLGESYTFSTPKGGGGGYVSYDVLNLRQDLGYSGRVKTVRGTFEDSYGPFSSPLYLPPSRDKYVYADKIKTDNINYSCYYDEVVLSNAYGSGYTQVDLTNPTGNLGVLIGNGEKRQNRYIRISAAPDFSGIALGYVSGQYPVVYNAPQLAPISCLQGADDLDYAFTSGQMGISRLTIESLVSVPAVLISPSLDGGVTASQIAPIYISGSSIMPIYPIYSATGDIRNGVAISLESGFIYHYEIVGAASEQASGRKYVIKDFGKTSFFN